MSDKRVLIADDSLLFSRFLKNVVDFAQGFTVCGCAANAYEARDMIERLKPDIIILDIEMPKMNGICFLRQLIPQYTVPVIICSSRTDLVMQALEAGAVDFIAKPADGGTYDDFKKGLIMRLKSASNLKRVKCAGKMYNIKNYSNPGVAKDINSRIIVIGGSAGSTEALPVILRKFNSGTPPVVAVLHMPHGYTKLYAKRLNDELKLVVTEAKQGLYLEKGMVVIAEGEKHMRIFRDSRGYFVSSEPGPRVSGHCPSADVLFESAAYCAQDNAIGVILTGMGSDGARGLAAMKAAGAYTIGQSEKTCAVYGMPKVAFERGAVDKQCDLEDIAAEIYSKLNLEF